MCDIFNSLSNHLTCNIKKSDIQFVDCYNWAKSHAKAINGLQVTRKHSEISTTATNEKLLANTHIHSLHTQTNLYNEQV